MSSACIGAASPGTLTQLISLGAADVYLTKCPTITFWRFRYNKYTNFAMDSIEQPFINQPQFGSQVQLTLNKTGDLIYFQYVVITLPGITVCNAGGASCGFGGAQFPCANPCDPCGDGAPPECACPGGIISSPQEDDDDDLTEEACTGVSGPYAHYTNAIGQALIRNACLIIGGQVNDNLWSDFLYMWEELAGQPGKRLTEMIGKRQTVAQLIADSRETRTLYVPLPWWFTMTSGNALSLISLQFHAVQINIGFEQLAKCVQVSQCDLTVVKCSDCTPLTAADLRAQLETLYIYLDVEERDRFATGSFEQLIVQHQQFSVASRNCSVQMQLNFNLPVIELIFAVRRQCQWEVNNLFNYSGKWGKDPIESVQLLLNNQQRFTTRPGRWFRLVQPYQFHTLIPDSFVYSYGFALQPEQAQPSGSANFSRLDTVYLNLGLQQALNGTDTTIIVYARNWQVFRYRQGLGGIAFGN